MSMPDLLTHVLLAYVGCTVLVHRGLLRKRHVPVGMIGAAIPDLTKLYLLIDLDPLEAMFGVPLDWRALHTLGASLVLVAMGALLFRSEDRRTVFALFTGGATLHLFLDSFVIRADGIAPPYLYPFTWWQWPAGNLFLSSDPWLSVIAVGLTAGTLFFVRSRTRRTGLESTDIEQDL